MSKKPLTPTKTKSTKSKSKPVDNKQPLISSFFSISRKPSIFDDDDSDTNTPPSPPTPTKTVTTNKTKEIPKTPEKSSKIQPIDVDKTPDKKSILQTPPKTPISVESLGLSPISPSKLNKNYKYGLDSDGKQIINENYNPTTIKPSPSTNHATKKDNNKNNNNNKSSSSKKKPTIFTSDEEDIDEVNKKKQLQNLKRKHESPIKGSANIKVNSSDSESLKDSDKENSNHQVKKVKVNKSNGISPPKKIQKSTNTSPTKNNKPTAQLKFEPIINNNKSISNGNGKKIKDDEQLTDEEDYKNRKVNTTTTSVIKSENTTPTITLPAITRNLSKEFINDYDNDVETSSEPSEPEDIDTSKRITKSTSKFDDSMLFDSFGESDDNNNNKSTTTTPNKSKFDDSMLFDSDSNSDNDTTKPTPVKRQTSGKYDDSLLFDANSDNEIPEIKKKPIIKKTTTKGKSKVLPSNITSTININKKVINPNKTEKKVDQPEKSEEKKAAARKWFAQGSRPPPPNYHSKPFPVGSSNCLRKMIFHLTGTLDILEREECEQLIVKYGGTIVKSVTKNCTHLIVGVIDASPKKIEKATTMKKKIINEETLFDLINSSVKNTTTNKQEGDDVTMIPADVLDQDEETEEELDNSDKENKEEKNKIDNDIKMTEVDSNDNKMDITPINSQSSSNTTPITTNTTVPNTLVKTLSNLKPLSLKLSAPKRLSLKLSSPIQSQHPIVLSHVNRGDSYSSSIKTPNSMKSIEKGHGQMWVDKYKPKTTEDLVGNANPIKEVSDFLKSWLITTNKVDSNTKDTKKSSKSTTTTTTTIRNGKNACLISGPPGIGKTSAVIMLCKELGFDAIELNASDTRSKNQMKSLLQSSIDNKSITNFFGPTSNNNNNIKKDKKICIILDEIDGSSGNEDRGGVSEIISAIKVTKVPFLCICNDYYSSKLKTLKSYCVDVKFRKPTSLQATPRLLQIAKNEDLLLSQQVAEKIYNSTNSDLRQSIHLLQMMSRRSNYSGSTMISPSKSSLTNTENIDRKLDLSKKDFEISPFTGAEKLLSQGIKFNIIQKLELFFTDFSLVPLLIQENYLATSIGNNYCRNNNAQRYNNGIDVVQYNDIDLLSLASDSISSSDLMDREIHKNMNWELLPAYGVLSSLIPTHFVNGGIALPLTFPSYLGKYSNASKQNRFVKELQLHMRVSKSSVACNKNDLRLHLVPMMCHYLTKPLSENVLEDKDNSIQFVINMMDKYGLTEEDRNNIVELSTWKSFGQRNVDPVSSIDKKIKSAFTRKWRNTEHTIYSDSAMTKKVSSSKTSSGKSEISGQFEEAQAIDDDNDYEDDDDDDQSNNNILGSSLIVQKKK